MELRKDTWRVFIIDAPVEALAATQGIGDRALRWLPGLGDLAYDADPFGIWWQDNLYVFVERFDYRDAHGYLAVHTLDRDLRWMRCDVALREHWHLSYPFVFEWEGAMWMLPEASASGALTLYRSDSFPLGWKPHCRIELDEIPIDATPFRWDGLWWLAYAPAGTAQERLTHLHLAWSETLDGEWVPHPANPVVIDPRGARPGGRAFEMAGRLVLPIQDCSNSYGSGMRLLSFQHLSAESVKVSSGKLWRAPAAAAPYTDGLHTMSHAGAVTLVDCKRRDFTLKGLAMKPRRLLARRRKG